MTRNLQVPRFSLFFVQGRKLKGVLDGALS